MFNIPLLNKIEKYDPELKKIRQWVAEAIFLKRSQSPFVILDVGCGNGRILKMLKSLDLPKQIKIRVIGVDVNNESIGLNRKAGFECYTPRELHQKNVKCDLLILSHVIEHFSPADLLTFMDSYLDYLTPNGLLLIATPLYSDCFYDDFDHVKPYQPKAFEAPFGPSTGQFQYYSRNLIRLERIWFRRGQLRVMRHPAYYFRKRINWVNIANYLGAIFFWLSRGRLGKIDGWVGLFLNLGPRP
jgi:SAM-dependent methyltransferase